MQNTAGISLSFLHHQIAFSFFYIYILLLSNSFIYFILLFVFSWIIGTVSTSSGADKSVYAPEPFDVGRILQADIVSNGNKISVITSGPIDPGWFFSEFLVFPFYILFPHVLIHIAIRTYYAHAYSIAFFFFFFWTLSVLRWLKNADYVAFNSCRTWKLCWYAFEKI